jgi:hypothetical protein
MELTAKQRKGLIAGAVGLGLFHFAPGIIANIHRGMHPAPAIAKPSPIRPMPAAAVTPPILAPPDAPLKQLSGVWIGEAMLQDKTSCKLRLELGVTPPDTFTGDSTLSCAPNLGMMTHLPVGNKLLMNELQAMKPVSGIFSGQAENGTINLKLEQLIGDGPTGCHPTEFAITPFGQNNIAAKWQQNDTPEKKCEPGDMIMRKAPR